MNRHSNHTNAKLLRKPKYVPPVHACTCRICGDSYVGHGAKCPNCILDGTGEEALNVAINNAILETREQAARANFTNVGKNADKEAE